MFSVLILLLLSSMLITILYNILFFNKIKKKQINCFKNVGSAGIAETEITLLYGIASFKINENCNQNIVCYSYREKIKKGERILITDYDCEKEMYIVDEYPNLYL